KHIASVSANYGFDLFGLPANLNVNLRYNGKQVDVGPGGIGTVLLDNYFLLGMAASVKVQNSIEIFARGENLLDQNYQEVLGFGTPGISGFVGLRVNIGAR
ncbi:MAG: TonB-dependent receptor, partial [Alphaproteobacteria bacterium]|nr:TonB-dependent receptor [Alphaproteobacteria bacterium]